MEETELRTRLDALAERTAPPAREPDELTATVVARHHAQRRRQWAVAAAVVAVLVLVPAVRALTAPEPQPRRTDPASRSTSSARPTRGSLADDTELVDAIRRLPVGPRRVIDPASGARDDRTCTWCGPTTSRRALGTRRRVRWRPIPRRRLPTTLRLAWPGSSARGGRPRSR